VNVTFPEFAFTGRSSGGALLFASPAGGLGVESEDGIGGFAGAGAGGCTVGTIGAGAGVSGGGVIDEVGGSAGGAGFGDAGVGASTAVRGEKGGPCAGGIGARTVGALS
jgi:hypothetical protein